MLTATDFANLRREFVTKKELKEEINNLRFDMYIELNKFHVEFDDFKKEMKDIVLTFKDEILHEIVTMREELTVTLGHRDMLEDHEVRIAKLEKKRSSKSN